MKVTRACDYAIRALLYMSGKPRGTVFMRSELSKLSEVPDSFLGKILQNLAKADILVSERGKKGGFRLEKNPDDISMYDVLLAIDGELQITDCLADIFYCKKVDYCKVHLVWEEIQLSIIDKMKKTSIKDLF